MTAKHSNYWRAGVYRQPRVADTPRGQRVNNARHAIWHFAMPYQFDFYQGKFRQSDGRYVRGEPVSRTLYATIQPESKSGILQQLAEGEREETDFVIHFDPAQLENHDLDTHLQSVGGTGLNDFVGWGVVVHFRGRLLRIRDAVPLEYGGDEEHGNRPVYRCIAAIWDDISQERRATEEVLAP